MSTTCRFHDIEKYGGNETRCLSCGKQWGKVKPKADALHRVTLELCRSFRWIPSTRGIIWKVTKPTG